LLIYDFKYQHINMRKSKKNAADKNLELVNQNLVFLRNQKQLTQEELAAKLGIKRASIGSYEEGRAKPPYKTLQKITDLFGISIDRLLKEDLAKTANRSVFGNETAVVDNTTQTSDKNVEKLKILALTVGVDGKENIELVPEKAAAGYLQGYTDPNYLVTLDKFRLPFLAPGTYRAFEIKGDSMLPLTSGTIIIGEYVESVREIKSGHSYIILSNTDGVVYKRVFKDTESDQLLMRSDNDIYKPYYMKAADVKEIWRARAYISQDLPDYESTTIDRLASQVYNLQSQLDSLKRKMGDA